MSVNDNALSELISKIKLVNLKPILPQIREIIRTSIDYNFEIGGRYGDEQFGGGNKRWIPSKRAIRQKGKTLVDTATLVNSIRVDVRQENNFIIIEVGSIKDYAKLHQFGGTANGIKIPARPFLVLQDTDIEQIKEIVYKYMQSIF